MQYIDILNLFKKQYYDFGTFKIPVPDEQFVKTQDLINNYMDILHNALFPNDFEVDYVEGTYMIPEFKLHRGNVVIDAGANIGLFSALACSMGCASIMFEPDTRPHYYIEGIRELNPSFNMILVPKALSDVVGFTTLRLSEKNGSSTIDKDVNMTTFADESTFPMIETTTIDQYMSESGLNRLDFVKADVEGEEAKMLWGAEESIKYFKPKLALCAYHRSEDKDELPKIIDGFNCGYKIIQKYQKVYAWVE